MMDEREPRERDYVEEAKNFAASDLGKTMIKGAAIGAVAAAILPFVGWGIGAVAGAGIAAYKSKQPK